MRPPSSCPRTGGRWAAGKCAVTWRGKRVCLHRTTKAVSNLHPVAEAFPQTHAFAQVPYLRQIKTNFCGQGLLTSHTGTLLGTSGPDGSRGKSPVCPGPWSGPTTEFPELLPEGCAPELGAGAGGGREGDRHPTGARQALRLGPRLPPWLLAPSLGLFFVLVWNTLLANPVSLSTPAKQGQ